jgi:Ca2+-binding EF-hand superfamily protein
LFRLFDTNNDRSISIQELGKAMRFLGMTPTQQQVADAMKTLDVDGQDFAFITRILHIK